MSAKPGFFPSDHAFLIVDTRNGGVDGYYKGGSQQHLNKLIESWKERLGHNDVIGVKCEGPARPRIGRCCLSDRYSNGQTTQAVLRDTKPPKELWAKNAINAATELLLAIYDRESEDSLRDLASRLVSSLNDAQWNAKSDVVNEYSE